MAESTKGNQYSFDKFTVIKENYSAYKLARRFALVKSTVKSCCIFGPSGAGKTHLLYAVRNRISEIASNLAVRVMTADELKEEICEAVKYHEDPAWYFMNYDILLIEDIQICSGKESIQEEMISIFDKLVASGKRIMLTSSRNSISDSMNKLLTPEYFNGECAVISRSWITIPVDCICLGCNK